MNYHFSGEEAIDSPSLIYYQDIIEENINKAIGLAGKADRLWPHMKTHKTASLLKMQIERGITRFKCATIAEAELCAMTGAVHVLLAYPLVGPAIERFVMLREKYTGTAPLDGTVFWAMGDNIEQLELLGKAAVSKKQNPVFTLVDVNIGMNRTGVLPEKLETFYHRALKIEGLNIQGLHGYDGHLGITDINERKIAVNKATEVFWEVKKSLEKQGYKVPILVMGGTPTFPCHNESSDVFLSPGTFFVQDQGYRSKFADLPFTPGAAILSRVISHPAEGLFTIDTGSKAIATDPSERGIIVDFPQAKPVLQSEEHWVWELEGTIPSVGTIVFILPTHICPTSALYSGVPVVKGGKKVDYWEIGGRNRKISI